MRALRRIVAVALTVSCVLVIWRRRSDPFRPIGPALEVDDFLKSLEGLR